MRALVRPLTLSLTFLVAVALAPLAAQAQPDPNQPYQPQPGYQQPQQYPQPGYQQPQQYPQPGYQQPQPAYPQQQYPQQQYQQPQQYPPQGYAPQGNPPPPGYYAPQPQPGYGPQPGYAPQPAYVAPPEEPFRRGFLFMPYIGFSVPAGDTSDYLSTGFRLGGLMGGMAGQFLSLNGELTIDVLEPKNAPADYSTTAVEFDLAFSPLFHLKLPMLEIVIGPKMGIFGYSESVTYNSGNYSDSTYSGSGAVWGLNSGAFIPIGRRMAVGGLLTYTVRSFSSCSSSSADCVSGPDMKFLSLTGAFIF